MKKRKAKLEYIWYSYKDVDKKTTGDNEVYRVRQCYIDVKRNKLFYAVQRINDIRDNKPIIIECTIDKVYSINESLVISDIRKLLKKGE